MSICPNRPCQRILKQVAKAPAAIQPARRLNRRSPSRKTRRIVPMAARAEGMRAETSPTPSVRKEEARISQKSRGGFWV
jgi:hypothetical protein